MKFRRARAFAAGAVLLAGLMSGCADSGSGSTSTGSDSSQPLKGKRIAIMTVTQSCDICKRITDATKDTVEKAGAEADVHVQEYDPALQAQQVNQAISQRVDLAIIFPADAAAVVPSLVRLKQARIPVVILDGLPQTDDKSLFEAFAGSNDVEYGKAAADAMIQGFQEKGLGDKGSVLVIQGFPGIPSTIYREKGFREQLAAKMPGIKVVGAQPGNFDQTQATDATAALLTKYPNVQGIYSIADMMMAGAITAAERSGLDPTKMVMVGTSCTIEGYNNMKNGKQYADILQDPYEEGGNAGQAAIDILTGKDVEQFIFNSHPIITKENLSECDRALGK